MVPPPPPPPPTKPFEVLWVFIDKFKTCADFRSPKQDESSEEEKPRVPLLPPPPVKCFPTLTPAQSVREPRRSKKTMAHISSKWRSLGETGFAAVGERLLSEADLRAVPVGLRWSAKYEEFIGTLSIRYEGLVWLTATVDGLNESEKWSGARPRKEDLDLSDDRGWGHCGLHSLDIP